MFQMELRKVKRELNQQRNEDIISALQKNEKLNKKHPEL